MLCIATEVIGGDVAAEIAVETGPIDIERASDVIRQAFVEVGHDRSFYGRRAQSPNDPKLSDGGGWRDGCAGEGGGAASVTAGAVRCSAWLGRVLMT